MESEGDASSDDSMSRPAPIPAHLFRNGPITLKAYRAACERTPAQPRRSRGDHPGASIISGEDPSSFSSMAEGVPPVQTRHEPPEQRKLTSQRVPARPENIYDLPASQDSGLNRSRLSSLEPVDNIAEIVTSAARQMKPPAKSRQDKPTVLGGDPFARLLVDKKKVRKRYTARRPSPITSKTSPISSDSEDKVNGEPSKKRSKKRRTLPMENELAMVPALGVRESPDTTVHIESDPIEETQMRTPVKIKRATRTPSQSRRRPLQSIQKNLRLPLQNGNPISNAFSFRALKITLPTAKFPMKDLAREGFDDHELTIPPRSKRKKPTARRAQVLPSLNLINARELEELPMVSHREAKTFEPEIDSTQQLPRHQEEPYFPIAETTVPDVEIQVDGGRHTPEPAVIPRIDQPTHVSQRLRRVSFCDDVHSQLISITAPMRELSESEDESQSFNSHESVTESGSESDHSDREEFEEMDFGPSHENINHNAELDEIEEEELLLETAYNGANTNVAGDIEVDDEPDDYLTRPGQLARMKSSGRLNEVPEDCIEIHSSSDPANSIPGYMARYHSSVTEPASTRMPKPLKSILKSTISSLLVAIHLMLTLCFPDRSDTRQSRLTQLDPQSIHIHTDLEKSSYFGQAQRQLDAPIRRHSIVPRHSQQDFRKCKNSVDDDNDTESESEVQASTPARVSDSSQYFIATSVIPRLSTNVPPLTTGANTPAPNIHTLVRRTSHEFGTVSARLRRTPSLPFVPPFLKDRA